MPRLDKTHKTRKTIQLKLGKNEKEALKAIGHEPRFPAKLEEISKRYNQH